MPGADLAQLLIPASVPRGLAMRLVVISDTHVGAGSLDDRDSCRYYAGCWGNSARVPSWASVTAAADRRKDAARRLSPVAFDDPCSGPPLRSLRKAGRDEAAVPAVEQSNWCWRSRDAGEQSSKAVCGRTAL